jgi:hypothetical protein
MYVCKVFKPKEDVEKIHCIFLLTERFYMAIRLECMSQCGWMVRGGGVSYSCPGLKVIKLIIGNQSQISNI